MIITAPLAALLEIAFPLAVIFWFMRRHPVSWWVVAAGAAAFLLSQVLHIPFLQAVQPALASSLPANLRPVGLAIFLGLAAGLFEETARAVCYKFLKRRAQSWPGGVALGLGHGGAESAIFIGLSGLITFFSLLALRDNPGALQGNAEAQIQLKAYWSMAWYLPLVGLAERAMTLAIQVGLSVIVLQAFTRRNALWFAAAVLWHALIDATVVWMGQSGIGIFAIEGAVLIFALISLGIVRALQPRAEAPVVIDESLGAV